LLEIYRAAYIQRKRIALQEIQEEITEQCVYCHGYQTLKKSEARGSKEEMEAGCKRETMVAAGFHVLLTRPYSSVHLFFASGTPGKPQIPNSHGLNLGVGETVRNDEKRERRCRDGKSSGLTAFIRFRTVNGYSFEDT